MNIWLIIVLLGAAGTGAIAADQATSEWVHPGPDGKLVYQTTPGGDRIMDFSHAGYRGGGVALPLVPTKRTVQPSGGEDDTAAIQAAIDQVAALPLDRGFRGAVVLGPGTFTCSKTITIQASGVVVRGSGTDEKGTTIRMTGPRHSAFTIGNWGRRAGAGPTVDDDEPARAAEAGESFKAAETTVADAYVPAGTATFTVSSAKGFGAGDTIAIHRPTTAAWIRLMQMDTLKRNGRPQTWIGTGRNGVTERKVTAISSNRITVDIPLADSYDAKYLNPPGTRIVRIRPSASVEEVGVEHLRIQCPPLEIAYGQAPYSAIRLNGEDCWVKDVFCEETMNATALRGKRLTLERVVVTHTFPNLGASKPTDFSIEGSQILLDRCRITGDNMYFVWTASLHPGPNVALNCIFRGRGSRIQPHMRWSTGLLVDNCTVPDGGIDFPNRGVTGSGHGWTMGWAVAWNCVANTYVIQNPPGAVNWAVGCIGTRERTARYFDTGPVLPEGVFDSHGTPVFPQSLYLAQLAERLGPQAPANIGYGANNLERAFAGKSVPRLPPWRAVVDPVLGPDLALHRPVNTGGVRNGSREFGGEKALDGDEKTYWALNDGVRRMTLEVDTEGPLDINAVALEEAEGLGPGVEEYKVEGQVDSDWKLLSQGTTIGARKVDRFPKTTVWKVRLTILKAKKYPAIRTFGFYLDRIAPPESLGSAKASTEGQRP